MKYLFGPVSSRRLGRSLGIDLVPGKICSFDCIYCEVGAKNAISAKRATYAPIAAIIAEIEQLVRQRGLDHFDLFTITASGEPTLHAGLGGLIAELKQRWPAKPVAILTNSSLFAEAAVRRACLQADIVIPSLDSAREASFQQVDRPHPSLRLDGIIAGLEEFRREYPGQIWLEVLLVAEVNDSEADLDALEQAVRRIEPDRIQLNTVVRPPRQADARPVDENTLHRFRQRLGSRAEIIATPPSIEEKTFHDSNEHGIVALLSRRPCPLEEICAATGLSPERATPMLEHLLQTGRITAICHNSITYYRANRT
ncbi:MAG: radical SAM protein [Thermodesulfobacteriota bacterium]